MVYGSDDGQRSASPSPKDVKYEEALRLYTRRQANKKWIKVIIGGGALMAIGALMKHAKMPETAAYCVIVGGAAIEVYGIVMYMSTL
jgi:hypothetical protein